MTVALAAAIAGLAVAAACAGGPGTGPSESATPSTAARSATPTSTTGAGEPVPASPPADSVVGDSDGDPAVVVVAVAIERRTTDAATAAFADVVRAALLDARGWQQAGFRFAVDGGAPYRIVLAEAAEVDALCAPYETGGRYSCQNGPVVALNADRWRTATPAWTGDLDSYRTMLVNHEVGHLLGQHHPAVQCPGPGEPAPVMAQQSTELAGCAPNPWPLPWEIACAARHADPLAPPFSRDVEPTCGP